LNDSKHSVLQTYKTDNISAVADDADICELSKMSVPKLFSVFQKHFLKMKQALHPCWLVLPSFSILFSILATPVFL